MADGGERVLAVFAALPPECALFARLPVDQRLRCREVSRAWCAALSDVSLWTRLDLSAASGVAAAHLENAAGLLAAAALRARGQLRSVDVTGCRGLDFAALRSVVAGSAATLRDLRVGYRFRDAEEIAALLRAAPQLRLLHAAEMNMYERHRELLQDEQLCRPLRLGGLVVHGLLNSDTAPLLALALRLARDAAPAELDLYNIQLNTAAAIGAVVDAALAHQMSSVSLENSDLSATAAPALARLLAGGAVTELLLCGYGERLWDDEAGAALLSNALRANTSSANCWISMPGTSLRPQLRCWARSQGTPACGS
jgi:hypothetical protein